MSEYKHYDVNLIPPRSYTVEDMEMKLTVMAKTPDDAEMIARLDACELSDYRLEPSDLSLLSVIQLVPTNPRK